MINANLLDMLFGNDHIVWNNSQQATSRRRSPVLDSGLDLFENAEVGTDLGMKDRRVRRTEQALRRAMVELILEKGFDQATVSEIAERADVGRSTFYAHYADKEDLLQGSVEALRSELQTHIEAAQQNMGSGIVHPALAFSLPMFEHAGGQRRLFTAMVGRRSGYLFLEFAQDMWSDFIRSSLKDADEIAVQSIAGAFRATLSWWLANAPELGAQEVNQRFLALIEPAMPRQR